ncbi:MAG TPA: hypothetical protein VMB85_20725 [Bryobacteraceae bacterium]|nr:hypothetical protein [Bryobacteraceae bacterium]
MRFFSIFLLTAATLCAQRPMTVAEVKAFIESQIKMQGDDHQTADYLTHRIRMSEKLDDRTVEQLQGEGAGPKTVAALRKLSEESATLPPAPPPQAPPPPPPPIPPPSAEEQQNVLAAMRDYALNYTKNLPNYMCVQTTHRKIDPTIRGYLPYGDTIQEQLTFFDKKESYKVEMVNGTAVANMTHEKLGGVVSSGEFGTMMYHIFDPQTGADFSWDHWATLRGKRMYVFAFSVPQSEGYSMYHEESRRSYTSAYKGLVYADTETKAIMRIKMDCVGIPADYPIHAVGLTLDYEPTRIGDEVYTLPFHFELHSRESKAISQNDAQFKLYRKFGSESTITFSDDPTPADQLQEQPATPGQPQKPPTPKKQDQ